MASLVFLRRESAVNWNDDANAQGNRKYGPWLVKSERLYEAMNTVDTGARQKGGLRLIESA